ATPRRWPRPRRPTPPGWRRARSCLARTPRWRPRAWGRARRIPCKVDCFLHASHHWEWMPTSDDLQELQWKGRGGPFPLLLTPGVFAPTHTSRTLAEALEIGPDDTVIDVGCGSG